MKLVDILARELKSWPDDWAACAQESNCRIAGFKSSQLIFDPLKGWDDWTGTAYIPLSRESLKELNMAEDYQSSIVTRAQWQAAIDALKAESAPAWVGIGLPPAGTVCEYDARAYRKGDPLWVTVEVKYLSEWTIVFACVAVPEGTKQENIGVELSADVGVPTINRFRPVRTTEQIAAEQEASAVVEMRSALPGWLNQGGHADIETVCTTLYQAGYRKWDLP